MKRLSACIIALLLNSSLFILKGLADDVTITVQTPTTIEAGDQFRVRFTISSQNVSNFNAPDFKGFEVIYGPATSRQSSIQIINGRTTQSSSITYTYVLLGSKPGTYTLNPATAEVGGKTVKSKPMQIHVTKLGQGAAAGAHQHTQSSSSSSSGRSSSRTVDNSSSISPNELFMTATASRTNVFEQEAILVTYKLYTLVNLTQLDGKLPTLDGFQIQEIPLPRTKEFSLETYNGRNYHTVVWSQYVLFPQKTGKLTIPSVTFEGVVVQPNRSLDPIDAFFNGASGMLELKKKIVTPALNIFVQPLPAKPEGYSSAVGKFSLSSSINSKEVKTNDAITIKVNVNGTGNMKLISTPEIAFPKDFETYDAKVTDNFDLTRSGLSGTKTFEYLAVPRHAGTYTIPAAKFVYFDTDSKSYKTLTTEPYTVKVIKGKGNSAQAVSDFTNGKEDIEELNQDIRFIKTNHVTPRKQNYDFFTTWKYALCYVIPLILFLLIVILGRKRINALSDIAATRGRKANKIAQKRLKLADSLMKEKKQNEFYDEVLKTLYGYIADKLNLHQENLNKDNVQQKLSAKNVPQEIIDQFIGTLNDCEFARYAPGDSDTNMGNIYEKAISIISKIEDNIKK